MQEFKTENSTYTINGEYAIRGSNRFGFFGGWSGSPEEFKKFCENKIASENEIKNSEHFVSAQEITTETPYAIMS